MNTEPARIMAFNILLSLGVSAALWPAAGLALEPGFEAPPVLQAQDVLGEEPLVSEFYTIAPEVPSDGFMAQYSISSEFGDFTASGPGMLEVRLTEIRALAALDAIAADEQFTDAAQGKALDKLGGLETLIEKPGETIKGLPEGVGRFFDRTGRTIRTGVQKIDAVRTGADEHETISPLPGAAPEMTAHPSVPLGELIAKAGGEAALNVLGFEEQRRGLAQSLGVDPYSTNPVLSAKLDEVTWAAFGGGLGVNVLTSLVPGGVILSTSSTMTDWVWNSNPGDIRLHVVATLREIGVPEAEIDQLLRHRAYTLSMHQVIADALDAMSGVDGLSDVIPLALSVDFEGQARFITQSLEMMKNYHLNIEPLVSLKVEATVLGQSAAGNLVAMAPVDMLSWNAVLAGYSERFLTDEIPVSLHVSGLITDRALAELEDLGWAVSAQTPLAPREYPIR